MSLEQKIDELNESLATLIATLSGAKVSKQTSSDADDADDDTTEKPAKRKRRTKAEIAADKKAAAAKAKKDEDEGDDLEDEGDDLEDEGDDLDDDADEDDDGDAITADTIRDLIHKVKDTKDASAARAILSEIGVKTIAQIPEKAYPKVITLAKKAGVKL